MKSRVRSILVAGLASLALIAGSFESAPALERHARDGWVVGVGYGLGYSKISTGSALGRLESGWEEGASPEIRIGHMLGKRFLIGYDQRQWFDEQGFGTTGIRASFQNYTAGLTFFPGSPDNETGGIYLRGTAGFANARLSVMPDAFAGIDSTHEEEDLDEGGTAFSIGGGYEFRIARPVAVGLDVSFQYQAIEGEVFDKTWFVPTTLNLTWYF